MSVNFKMKIGVMDLYRFLLHHSYHSFSGVFSIGSGAALIIFYIINRGKVVNDWIYVAFGLLFLVYLPWSLYTKAAQQVKLGSMFKKPLHYQLTEKGIEVKQEEASQSITWNQVYSVKETGSCILVYTSAKNAFIWVKKQMGNEEMAVRDLMKKKVPAAKLNLKRK